MPHYSIINLNKLTYLVYVSLPCGLTWISITWCYFIKFGFVEHKNSGHEANVWGKKNMEANKTFMFKQKTMLFFLRESGCGIHICSTLQDILHGKFVWPGCHDICQWAGVCFLGIIASVCQRGSSLTCHVSFNVQY